MYIPSETFYDNVVKAQTRQISWSGTITTEGGTAYNFTSDNIAKDSGTIVSEISGDTMEIGTAYSSELDIGLYLADIGMPKSLVYESIITLNCTMSHGSETAIIPLGKYKVTEATQSGEICTITAYDFMLLFDKEFPVMSGANKPFEWAEQFCDICGVELATTQEQFEAFANGALVMPMVWADSVATYRDAVKMIASAVGCSAHFNRLGQLEFIPLKSSDPVTTISANDRYSSDIAHTSWTPSSIYLANSESGEVTHSGSGQLVIDIADNAFLQSNGYERTLDWKKGVETSVSDELNNILSQISEVTATPVETNIPLDPCLDLFDIVTLAGGHSNNNTILATSIVHKIGGETKLICAGSSTADAPKATDNNAEESRNTVFWMTSGTDGNIIIGTTITTWAEASEYTWSGISEYTWGKLIEGYEDIVVAHASINIYKELQKAIISFTVNYELSQDAEVIYKIFMNNNLIWKTTASEKAGSILKTITTPATRWIRGTENSYVSATISGVDSA